LAEPEATPISDLRGKADFVLAFAVVHELPPAAPFFQQAAEVLKPGAFLLLAEPRGHVKAEKFEAEMKAASQAEFGVAGRPPIAGANAACCCGKPPTE
jgi:SAM-dependent methyltransferase